MKSNFRITQLGAHDSAALSMMLRLNSTDYQRYFYPFSFEEQAINKMLVQAINDKYWGIWKENVLMGFFMLRGFDEGYKIPSYGVCIAEAHSGKGLLKLSLQFVLSWCRIYDIPKLMLKVHPENSIAKSVYEEIGFEYTGIDQHNHNLIYHYSF